MGSWLEDAGARVQTVKQWGFTEEDGVFLAHAPADLARALRLLREAKVAMMAIEVERMKSCKRLDDLIPEMQAIGNHLRHWLAALDADA